MNISKCGKLFTDTASISESILRYFSSFFITKNNSQICAKANYCILFFQYHFGVQVLISLSTRFIVMRRLALHFWTTIDPPPKGTLAIIIN